MKVHTMGKWNKRIVGMNLTGRWSQQTYRLVQYLGQGATGVVYLAKQLPSGPFLALKMSDAAYAISSEVNILKKLSKTTGTYQGPKFYHIDDGEIIYFHSYKKVYFYTMEYIEGMSYTRFIAQNGNKWAVVFLLQILKNLCVLHRARWAFGDLKVDNLLVSSKKTPQIRWFDVGGFTEFGKSVKEYTEFYDRGYWGAGSRKASVQYDLFAACMIFLEAYYPKRFQKHKKDGKVVLYEKIKSIPELFWFLPIFEKVWNGRYQSAAEMHRDVQSYFIRATAKKKRMQATLKQQKRDRIRTKIWRFFLQIGVVLISILGGYILYLFYQT